MNASGLVMQSVSVNFGVNQVLDEFDLTIEPGEIVAITGPSGAGKTTLCRTIAGLENPSQGWITIGGRDVTMLPPHERRVAFMFESYALYPQMTLEQNVAFPLRAPARRNEYTPDRIAAEVSDVLKMTKINHLRDRYPGELSGGQKQRVALCRALAQESECYIFDEPISHLDAKLRNELRGEIRRRQITKSVPTLWATPDAMEALSIADRVVVLIDGTVHQFGSPEDVYFSPATTEVARLVGDPAMNLLECQITRTEGGAFLKGAGFTVPIQNPLAPQLEQALVSSDMTLGVHPNNITLKDVDTPEAPGNLRVYAWEPFGNYSVVSLQFGKALVRVKRNDMAPMEIGRPVGIEIDPTAVVIFQNGNRVSI